MNETREARWFFSLAPALVLACYAWFIAHSYSQHLDWDLRFQKPVSGFSPDDILGIGFFLPWLFFLVVFLFALFVGLIVVSRRFRFGIFFVFMFGAFSAIDLYLYRVLEQQVLAFL